MRRYSLVAIFLGLWITMPSYGDSAINFLD
jgi:hypothetical protein